jgi:NADPH-dependent curcumin reductase CurA
MNLKKIIKEEMDDFSWVSQVKPEKINNPKEKQKVFQELMSSLHELPRSTYPSDIKYYFENVSITEFDDIIKNIRNLAIEYKMFK